jgi:hypothetical protein
MEITHRESTAKMKGNMDQTSRLHILDVVFLGVADTCGGESISEKCWNGAMMLSTVTCLFILAVIVVLSDYGVHPLRLLTSNGSVGAEHIRDFTGVGFKLVLFLSVPVAILWRWYGKRYEHLLVLVRASSFRIALSALWLFVSMFGFAYIGLAGC